MISLLTKLGVLRTVQRILDRTDWVYEKFNGDWRMISEAP